MDFFSKFTKPDQSKPASDQEPNTTEPSSNTDLFNSAKVVSGAAQSYFTHQPATYENAEVAGATADILGSASEYGKLDKTQGVGKYVDQAENYLKEYETSSTPAAAAPTTTDTAVDAGGDSVPTTEAAETDTVAHTAATKRTDAITEESSKPGLYGEEMKEGLPSKPAVGDTAAETDTSDVYGEDKADGLPKKTSGGGAGTETDAGDDYTQSGGKYGEDTEEGGLKNLSGGDATTKTDVSDDYEQPKADKYEDTTEEDFTKKPAAAATDASDDYKKDTEEGFSKKPSSGGKATGTDKVDTGYTEDTEEGLPKPSAGSYGAAVDDAIDKVGQAEGGFGNFTKAAGGFFNK